MAINNKYLHTVYSHSIIRLLHTVRFVVNLLNSGSGASSALQTENSPSRLMRSANYDQISHNPCLPVIFDNQKNGKMLSDSACHGIPTNRNRQSRWTL